MITDIAKKAAHLIIDRPRNRILDVNSARRIERCIEETKNRKDESRRDRKIKVAFVSQMPEVWDKQAPVYERMAADDRFDVWIVLTPNYNSEIKAYDNWGEIKEFFHAKYKDGQFLNAVGKTGRIIDLTRYGFDYIFYERPYFRYIPKKMRIASVAGKIRTCYIPYTTPDYGAGSGIHTPDKEFYRDVYIGFHNCDSRIDRLYKSMWKSCHGAHQYINLGYPVLNECTKIKPEPHTGTVVMWTPRWSYGEGEGGSHFLEYKDEIIKLGEEFPGVKMLLRPHPFTFKYMVEEGYMTEEEVEAYKAEADRLGAVFDKNKMINDSFMGADILISDFSSIVWQFFYQGKPIIYCLGDNNLSSDLKELVDVMYVAESFDDVKRYMAELSKGNDYMKADRQKVIDKYLKKYDNSADDIVEYIVKDFREL